MSEKPIFNYIKRDGSLVSFRESMSDYAPTKKEFKKLKAQIERILEKETTPEFDNILNYLITLLRNQIFIHNSKFSSTKIGSEVKRLEGALKRLNKLLASNGGLSDSARFFFWTSIKNRHPDVNKDLVYDVSCGAEALLEACGYVRADIKGQKSDFTPNDMRQILAEELARELEKMGEMPTKYRDGSYFQILRSTLEMIPCTVHKQRIAISIPDDLFEIAKDAIDSYPGKEPYSLLSFD